MAPVTPVQAGIHLREIGRFDDLVRLAEQEIELVAVVGAVNPDDGPGGKRATIYRMTRIIDPFTIAALLRIPSGR